MSKGQAGEEIKLRGEVQRSVQTETSASTGGGEV